MEKSSLPLKAYTQLNSTSGIKACPQLNDMLRKLFKGKKSRRKTASQNTSKNEDLLVRFVLTEPGIKGEYLFEVLLRIFDIPADKRAEAATKLLDVLTDIDISIKKLFAFAISWESDPEAKTYSIDSIHGFIADHKLLND